MYKFLTAITVSFVVSGCTSSTPPICYNKAKIVNKTYDVAIFKKEDNRYLAGYPFYSWEDESQFTDTQGCDILSSQ